MFTWLYNNTNGNLLIAVLFNTLGHMLIGMFPSKITFLYIINGLIAAVLVLFFGAKILNKGKGAKR